LRSLCITWRAFFTHSRRARMVRSSKWFGYPLSFIHLIPGLGLDLVCFFVERTWPFDRLIYTFSYQHIYSSLCLLLSIIFRDDEHNCWDPCNVVVWWRLGKNLMNVINTNSPWNCVEGSPSSGVVYTQNKLLRIRRLYLTLCAMLRMRVQPLC